MLKSYGRVGYEAYCNHTNWKSLATGQDLPQWDNLKPEIQMAWLVAGDAVATYTLATTIDD